MRNGKIVIDGVGHVYDLADDNRREQVPKPVYDWFIGWLYKTGHESLESAEGGYLLSREEFTGGWTTEELVRLFFVESDVDMIAMHEVNFFNVFVRGGNPWDQCRAVKDAAPHRTLLYAACDPLADRGAQFELMAQRAAEGVNGFKFYPVSGFADIHHRPLSYRFDDEAIFPYFEHARNLGVMHIAVHKALPAAHGSNVHDRPDDVTGAAAAFPDMTFEVVHSGWAFLDDCALQLALNLNIYANLEVTANTVVRQPRRFARSVGALVREAPDRVLFGTGAPLGHPQPIIEAIEAFEMPQDLLEEGLPEFTAEVKAGIMGGNFARMHGLDPEAIEAAVTGDEFTERRKEYVQHPDPWQPKKDRIAARAGAPV
jgi:predicted TIM-barrel fold metal-dependent hydrolase